MSSSSMLKPLHLAALIFSILIAFTGTAQAAVATAQPMDRGTLYAAQGEFVLQDGRAVNLKVYSRNVAVRFDDQSEQRWKAESPTVLVSPDGRQRLHLHRDTAGSVNQVSLESPRAR